MRGAIILIRSMLENVGEGVSVPVVFISKGSMILENIRSTLQLWRWLGFSNYPVYIFAAPYRFLTRRLKWFLLLVPSLSLAIISLVYLLAAPYVVVALLRPAADIIYAVFMSLIGGGADR